jgi:hypothetical protein
MTFSQKGPDDGAAISTIAVPEGQAGDDDVWQLLQHGGRGACVKPTAQTAL